jgi:glycosyltransferase involved in cell wall biosynthesis
MTSARDMPGSLIFLDDAHTFGGAQIALGHAIRAVIEHTNLEVTCVCTVRTRLAILNIIGESSRVTYIDCPKALPLNIFSFPFRLPAFWRLLGPLVSNARSHVWLLNLSGIEFCLAALLVLRRHGIRPSAWLHNPERFSIFTQHSSLWKRAVSRIRDAFADQAVFSQYDRVMTPSGETARYACARRTGNSSRMLASALYPTITGLGDQKWRSEQSRGRADILDLWMIGRIEYGHKNNRVAIDALKALLDMGVPARLSVVGDGPDRERLLTDIRELQIMEAVDYLGWRDNPWRDLPRGAIVLVPSRWEAFSLVAMEALLREVKLVLSPIRAFLEVYPTEVIAEESTGPAFSRRALEVAAMGEEELQKLYAGALEQYSPAHFARRLLMLIDYDDRGRVISL